MADDLKKSWPGVRIQGGTGRNRSFEVTVNGKLVHSKLETGNFPTAEEILKKMKEAQ